jgi:hypothetical protein
MSEETLSHEHSQESQGHTQVVVVETPDYTVVREHLPAGALIERHTHESPHIIIPISGGVVEQLDADGNPLFVLDYDDLEPAHILHLGAERMPLTHSLRNIGTKPWVHLRIDIHKS